MRSIIKFIYEDEMKTKEQHCTCSAEQGIAVNLQNLPLGAFREFEQFWEIAGH